MRPANDRLRQLLPLLEKYNLPACWAFGMEKIFHWATLHNSIAVRRREQTTGTKARSRALQAIRNADEKLTPDLRRVLKSEGVDFASLARRAELQLIEGNEFFAVGDQGRPKTDVGRQRDFVIKVLMQRFEAHTGALPTVHSTDSKARTDEEVEDADGAPIPQPFVQFLTELFKVIGCEGSWLSGVASAAQDVRSKCTSGTRAAKLNDRKLA